MIRDIIGQWDVSVVEKGKVAPVGRLDFWESDGRLLVIDMDPEAGTAPSRVDFDGAAFRFELASGGSARGTTRHTFEVILHGAEAFGGTRRRGMMARVPISAQRVGGAAGVATSSLAEAKAKAAEAAERAAVAAADAAAALAEVEAATAFEAARRAAETAASARAAATAAEVPLLAAASAPRPPVPAEVLALLPAPAVTPAFPAASVQAPPSTRRVQVTHRLTCGDSMLLAVELLPGVFVWGESFPASEQRLREVGWTATPIASEATLEVEETQIQHAFTVHSALAS